MVRDYTAETGRSIPATIHAAIENDRRTREAAIADKIRRVNEIVDDFQRNMPDEWRNKSSKKIMDLIYDDNEPDGFAR